MPNCKYTNKMLNIVFYIVFINKKRANRIVQITYGNL